MRICSCIILILCALASGCTSSGGADKPKVMTVTISPVKFIVEKIVGNDFQIDILVPDGASPETYEPTPQQVISMADSKAIFTTGLIDFEREVMRKYENLESVKLVNLSENIETIDGDCAHDEHQHGVDPHIWTSPKQLKIMAKSAYEAIALLYPDSVKYKESYIALDQQLTNLDIWITETTNKCSLPYFVIYHPAMTYYAADYGIKQVALESEGKEPAAEAIKALISNAKRDGISQIFYQKQFSKSAVESIANEIGAEIIEIDPLSVDVIENLRRITLLITDGNNHKN